MISTVVREILGCFNISISALGSQAFRSLALQEVRLRRRVANLKNLIREAQIALLAAVEEPQTSDFRLIECLVHLPLLYLSPLYLQIWKYVYHTCHIHINILDYVYIYICTYV